MVDSDAWLVMHASTNRHPWLGKLPTDRAWECLTGSPWQGLSTALAPFPRDFSTALRDFPTQTRVAPWDFLTSSTNRIKLISNSSVEKSHS